MPATGMDQQETYLRTLFNFIGMSDNDIHFVRAERRNNPQTRPQSVQQTKSHIDAILKPYLQ